MRNIVYTIKCLIILFLNLASLSIIIGIIVGFNSAFNELSIYGIILSIIFLIIGSIITYFLARWFIHSIKPVNVSKCPKCGLKTILKTVTSGKDSGKKFYVCENYPECKGRIKVCGTV